MWGKGGGKVSRIAFKKLCSRNLPPRLIAPVFKFKLSLGRVELIKIGQINFCEFMPKFAWVFTVVKQIRG